MLYDAHTYNERQILIDRSVPPNTNQTLVDLLQECASQNPGQVVYTFLEDGERERDSLTYQQLDEKARSIAAYLQTQLSPGDRVLLVYPQGLEAIAALFGCLYAGVIAIPAPAPETSRLKRTLPRLEAIAADAGASLILTTRKLLTKSNSNLAFHARSCVGRMKGRSSLLLRYYLATEATSLQPSHLATLPWIATETIPAHFAAQWHAPKISGNTLAYLQYTSGSTSTPKGVMLDHNNLMGHLAALQQAGGYNSNSVTVTWMPYFHDYGLVEGILEPLYNGTPCYLMSPVAFIKQPLRWLNVISRYRATHSQAPNFAYAYCLHRITPTERDTLDLSRWQAAGNAAEPINPDVMEQFCQMFASCGFVRHAFAPAYGLAEATLLVTMSRKLDAPVFCTVDAEALAQNRIVETAMGQRLAGSGRLLAETQVVIVHPETRTRCANDEVGEIWVASVGVARGYWQRPEATQETFCADLADTGEGYFLRTGDLGFIKDRELFVTGRLKDLIIIRGENYYPQDIEWVVEKSHPALRPNYGAAFSIEMDGVEQLVIAFEVDRTASKNLDVDEVVAAIRNAIAEHYELPVYGIALLKRGSIPKTSSGKIQRQACRQAFLAGTLQAVASWDVSAILLSATEYLGAASVDTSQLNLRIAAIWREVLEVAVIQGTDNFFELGGDSVRAAILVSEIGVQCKVNLELSAIAEAPTLNEFVQLVQAQNDSKPLSCLVPIRATGNKIPFFYVHGMGGSSLSAEQLVPYFDPERPVYGLNAVGLQDDAEPHTRMDDMAQHYIQEIQTVQPEGPYLLGGSCFGGTVAFEMARQLTHQGKTVLVVAMADSVSPIWAKEQVHQFEEYWQTAGKIKFQGELKKQGLSDLYIEKILRVRESNHRILGNYSPQVYSGRVVYFSAEENQLHDFGFGDDGKNFAHKYLDPMQPGNWNDWLEVGLEVVKVPGRHGTYHNPPHVQVYAEKLNACLESVDQSVKAFLDISLDSSSYSFHKNLSEQQKSTSINLIKAKLAQIWQKVLDVSPISVNDNFFELGGESLKAAVVVADVEKLLDQTLPLGLMMKTPTIEQLVNFITRTDREENFKSLVPIKPNGSKRPFFYIHGITGYNLDVNLALANHIAPDRPFYGLQAVGIDGQEDPFTHIEDVVAHYIEEIQRVQTKGPYLLGGVCIGGNIAFEIAQALKKQDQEVLLVAMVDSPNPFVTEAEKTRLQKLRPHLSFKEKLIGKGLSVVQVENIFRVWEANIRVMDNHKPQAYSGQVIYFSAKEAVTETLSFDPTHLEGWSSLAVGRIKLYKVPGSHLTMHFEPHVQVLAKKLNASLEEADRSY